MNQARLSQSRRWRGVLLVVLCALVYYVSYDHGRESPRPRLEAQERRFQEERGRMMEERARLEAQLARCQAAPADSGQTNPGRIALKLNQSRTLFDGRLVLSVQDIDREAGRVLIQLNFVREKRQMVEDLTVGDNLGFRLGGRDWAVVVAGLTLTTANLNLMEISDP
jgi:hypothetical protein